MSKSHKSFWWDLGGKIGPAVFSASVVACLLADQFKAIQAILMGCGLLLIYLEHRYVYHERHAEG